MLFFHSYHAILHWIRDCRLNCEQLFSVIQKGANKSMAMNSNGAVAATLPVPEVVAFIHLFI
jgi:hypothetical protein